MRSLFAVARHAGGGTKPARVRTTLSTVANSGLPLGDYQVRDESLTDVFPVGRQEGWQLELLGIGRLGLAIGTLLTGGLGTITSLASSMVVTPARRSSVTSRSWNVPAVRSTRPFACGDLANIWRIPSSSMAGAGELGWPGRLLARLSSMLEDRVSVAVDGQRYPALPDQPLHEKEVAAGVLLLAEQSVRHRAGGVVHGQQQDEPGSLFPQPPMVAPIYLQQHPFLGHAFAPDTVSGRPTAAGAVHAGADQDAAHRRAAQVDPLPFHQQLGQMRMVRVSSLSLVRYRTNDYSVPVAYGHMEVVVRGYVGEVVISCGAEVIARHRRSYERDDFVFDPVHYLPLLERKTGALDQAAPLAGWELPEEFGVLRRLLESRMGRRGKREFVQVLRLMESFRKEEVYEGVRDALRLGAISFDAVKHLVLCRVEGRPQRLDLQLYPYLPRVSVTRTAARDYMALMPGSGR